MKHSEKTWTAVENGRAGGYVSGDKKIVQLSDAAPELLEACKQALFELESSDLEGPAALIRTLREALLKAGGAK